MKTFAITAVVAVLASSVGATEIKLVQDVAYPPYTYAEGGTPKGIIADIVNEANSRMDGYNITVEAMPWSRALATVEGGAAQGLLGTYYRPSVRPWISDYSVPTLEEVVSVYCHTGVAQASWRFPEDFKGLTFGNNRGYGSAGARFFEMVDAGEIKLQEVDSTVQNIMKLAGGRVDCYVQERLNAEMAINAKNVGAKIERVTDVSVEKNYIGYGDSWTSPDAKAFISAMDQTITAMREDGTIDRIIANNTGS